VRLGELALPLQSGCWHRLPMISMERVADAEAPQRATHPN